MLTLSLWVVPCAIVTVKSQTKNKKTEKLQSNVKPNETKKNHATNYIEIERKKKQRKRNGIIAVMRINIEMKITNNG